MKVDVIAEIDIDRPRAEVAAFAADLDNTTSWYVNIKSVALGDVETSAGWLQGRIPSAISRPESGLHLSSARTGARRSTGDEHR